MRCASGLPPNGKPESLPLDPGESGEDQRTGMAGSTSLPLFSVMWYEAAMMITLALEQEAWLNAYVARGDFPSIEEAARLKR